MIISAPTAVVLRFRSSTSRAASARPPPYWSSRPFRCSPAPIVASPIFRPRRFMKLNASRHCASPLPLHGRSRWHLSSWPLPNLPLRRDAPPASRLRAGYLHVEAVEKPYFVGLSGRSVARWSSLHFAFRRWKSVTSRTATTDFCAPPIWRAGEPLPALSATARNRGAPAFRCYAPGSRASTAYRLSADRVA